MYQIVQFCPPCTYHNFLTVYLTYYTKNTKINLKIEDNLLPKKCLWYTSLSFYTCWYDKIIKAILLNLLQTNGYKITSKHASFTFCFFVINIIIDLVWKIYSVRMASNDTDILVWCDFVCLFVSIYFHHLFYIYIYIHN